MLTFVSLVLGSVAPAMASLVLAQIGGPHDPVVPYVVVVLCVALGMIVLCRSANRSSDVKLDDLEEE
jgi:hypothetical protein